MVNTCECENIANKINIREKILSSYFIVIMYINTKSISWVTIKFNSQENLININEATNEQTDSDLVRE